MQRQAQSYRSTGINQLRQQHQRAMMLQQVQKRQLQLQYQHHRQAPQPELLPRIYPPVNKHLQQPIYPNHPSLTYAYEQRQPMVSKPTTTQNIHRQGNKRKRQDIGQNTIETATKLIPSTGAQTSSTLKQQSKTLPNKKGGSLLVESGLPTDILGEGLEWPKGWTKIKKQRLGGASAGSFDCYWITPIHNFRLRSLPEVRKFLRALQANGGDEVLAKKIFKRKTPKQEKTKIDKDEKSNLGKRKKTAGKPPKPKGNLRQKDLPQTTPSSAIAVSADKPSSIANKSPHMPAAKKTRVSKSAINTTAKNSKENVSFNSQNSMNRHPVQPAQGAITVAAKTSVPRTLSKKSADTIATSIVSSKKPQTIAKQQPGGQLSKQQQKQKTPIPGARGMPLECPVSDQNEESSVISGGPDDLDYKIGFAEYHIEL